MYLNITQLGEINNPFVNLLIRRSPNQNSVQNSAEQGGEDYLGITEFV